MYMRVHACMYVYLDVLVRFLMRCNSVETDGRRF